MTINNNYKVSFNLIYQLDIIYAIPIFHPSYLFITKIRNDTRPNINSKYHLNSYMLRKWRLVNITQPWGLTLPVLFLSTIKQFIIYSSSSYLVKIPGTNLFTIIEYLQKFLRMIYQSKHFKTKFLFVVKYSNDYEKYQVVCLSLCSLYV